MVQIYPRGIKTEKEDKQWKTLNEPIDAWTYNHRNTLPARESRAFQHNVNSSFKCGLCNTNITIHKDFGWIFGSTILLVMLFLSFCSYISGFFFCFLFTLSLQIHLVISETLLQRSNTDRDFHQKEQRFFDQSKSTSKLDFFFSFHNSYFVLKRSLFIWLEFVKEFIQAFKNFRALTCELHEMKRFWRNIRAYYVRVHLPFIQENYIEHIKLLFTPKKRRDYSIDDRE